MTDRSQVLIAVVAVILTWFLTYSALATVRKRYQSPTYIPTQWLKNKWRRWQPRTWSKPSYSSRLHDDESVPTLHLDRSARISSSHLSHTESASHSGSFQETQEHASGNGVGVERNTSIRSVMTLPAYSKSVRENEQILGREGERGGIDVVLEGPETAEEEEDRREEEMESLYQIRRQRRDEIADREDRRQRRREARQRGDYLALRELRQESLLAAQERELTGAVAMIADHQSRSRERRVSSVSYGELGVARHDGTRIRAGSASSDHQPLLDSAASISGQSMRPAVLRDSLGIHHRGRSTSSIMSGASSIIEDSEMEAPPFGRAGSDFEVVTLGNLHSRNASLAGTPSGTRSRASSHTHRPSIDTSGFTGGVSVPLSNPPAYDGSGFEQAPAYMSPATYRASEVSSQKLPSISTTNEAGTPLLPEIGRLPSIRIAEATPIETRTTEAFPPFQ